jgi:hypothetical protein
VSGRAWRSTPDRERVERALRCPACRESLAGEPVLSLRVVGRLQHPGCLPRKRNGRRLSRKGTP